MSEAGLAMEAGGATRFARFAYPPNELGLCGPDDHRALLEYAASGEVDRGLVHLAHSFEGAWPYLELLAGAAGADDPLAAEVVEAYWIGSPLSDRVGIVDLGNHLDDRFRRRAGRQWERVVDAVACGIGVTHQFHVFEVHPWVGLLRSGARDHALHVLDRCRIRAARVLEVDGSSAVVRGNAVRCVGDSIVLVDDVDEVVCVARDGMSLAAGFEPGALVAVHWDWVCERISIRQAHELAVRTAAHVARANDAFAGFELRSKGPEGPFGAGPRTLGGSSTVPYRHGHSATHAASPARSERA